MMNKILTFILSLGLIGVLSAPTAAAHVLIRDTTNNAGAVLHVTPDDDPIAGETAGLYFSLQNQSLKNSNVALTITSQTSGESERVSTTMNPKGISAEYTFPARGLYNIRVTIDGTNKYVFSYAQRVSRGIGSDDVATNGASLARAGLIISTIALIAVILLAISRRNAILNQSSF